MEEESKTGSTLDLNGKESAKRKWMARLFWNALGFFYMVALITLSYHVRGLEVPERIVPEFLREMWIWIMVGALSFGGLTVFEFLSNYFKKT